MSTLTSHRHIAALADTIVEDHTAVAMAASLVPIPLVEFAVVSAVHLKMVERLANLYQVDFPPERAKTIVASLITAYFSTYLGLIAVNRISKFVPGLGSLVSTVTMPAVAGTVTFAMGRVFVRHFKSGGTIPNLDLDVARTDFLQEVAKKKALRGETTPAHSVQA
jgi:uncharacterized protein (DUF697 family)